MPHGITQTQVDTAADGLLQAGERPTVEKVRAQLGTGSPNTITRMLDAWRLGLAERLRTANEIPSLPDEVGQAMTALWNQAVQHAREQTHQEIQAERDALQQSRSALDAREAEQAALLATAQETNQEAKEVAHRAVAETTTLRRLADRLESEAVEHATERSRLRAQNQALETACAKLRDEIRTIEAKAAKERRARDEHLKVVEDRAHAEVDRVRTELKVAHVEHASTQKHYRTEMQVRQRTINDLTRELGVAERDAAHQRGVAEALKLKIPSRREKSAPPNRRRSRTAESPVSINADVRAGRAKRRRS